MIKLQEYFSFMLKLERISTLEFGRQSLVLRHHFRAPVIISKGLYMKMKVSYIA